MKVALPPQPKRQVPIAFTEREIDWLNNYAGNHEMTIDSAVRQAVRTLSLVDGVPGAREALQQVIDAHIGPKYEPMPPLPEEG